MSRFLRLFWILAVLALAAPLAAPLPAAASPVAAGGGPNASEAGTAAPARTTAAATVTAASGTGDSLYVGDITDNSVKRFDAQTGAYQGAFVAPGAGGLDGPRGLVFTQSDLYLSSQNVDYSFNGEVLQYDGSSGAFLGALVPCNPPLSRVCSPNSPIDPRGIIAGLGHTVYVADLEGGKVWQYDSKTGAVVGSLDPTGFTGDFFPRGLVLGPDGRLYVSTRSLTDRSVGYVLRFNPNTNKFIDVFASYQRTSDCASGLHRPEGLVFGPDGNLYVTAFTMFSGDPSDTDKVLIFNGKTGACQGQINLDQASEISAGVRAFAQALLFGPGGYLFVPISGGGPDTGAVRRYNVAQSGYPYTNFVAPGGPLGSGWYLTFRGTNPSTLAYAQ